MIFLPNKFERFLAALRITIQNDILKNGITENNLKNLEKINIAEALFYKDFKEPVYIKELSFSLLCYSLPLLLPQNKNPYLKIDIYSNFLINKKLLAILFLKLIKASKRIEIKNHKSKIMISALDINSNNFKKLVLALGGTYFYHNKKIIIVIPADKTDKKANPIKKEWVSLDNPFSLVNIFLNL